MSGDLTDDEQVRLDAHLATCETCRRDDGRLGPISGAWSRACASRPFRATWVARVRAGIESGAFAVPWWRRNGLLVGVAGASLATVAAAVLAVVVISDLLPGPPVASSGSPSATASDPPSSPRPDASIEPAESPAPIAQPPRPRAAGDRSGYLAPRRSVGKRPSCTFATAIKARSSVELPTPPGPPIASRALPGWPLAGLHHPGRPETGSEPGTGRCTSTDGSTARASGACSDRQPVHRRACSGRPTAATWPTPSTRRPEATEPDVWVFRRWLDGRAVRQLHDAAGDALAADIGGRRPRRWSAPAHGSACGRIRSGPSCADCREPLDRR